MTDRTTLTRVEVAFVMRQRVARLATADADGHPHVIPVCYAFDGTSFYIPLDEKPKSVSRTKLRRVRNIEARHEASLVIDQYSDDWSQLGYVLIYGRAELIMSGDTRHAPALVLLRQRYVQYRTMALEQYPIIGVGTGRVTSWGSGIIE